MDPEKKRALDLIEASVKKLSVRARGEQLLCVVRDYIEDGNVREARRVLGLIEDAYYDCPVPAEQLYMEALAVVVGTFGADLRWFSRRDGQA